MLLKVRVEKNVAENETQSEKPERQSQTIISCFGHYSNAALLNFQGVFTQPRGDVFPYRDPDLNLCSALKLAEQDNPCGVIVRETRTGGSWVQIFTCHKGPWGNQLLSFRLTHFRSMFQE